jgi:large subunit ribosomal protein L13
MITIDAQGKTLGRVASEAANVILGKHKADFAEEPVIGEEVKIINASKVAITGDKRSTRSTFATLATQADKR